LRLFLALDQPSLPIIPLTSSRSNARLVVLSTFCAEASPRKSDGRVSNSVAPNPELAVYARAARDCSEYHRL